MGCNISADLFVNVHRTTSITQLHSTPKSKKAMDIVKEFLESSTIHGLSYIVSTKKFSKFLWICVVVAGFTVAGILIQESFESWTKNKISTVV